MGNVKAEAIYYSQFGQDQFLDKEIFRGLENGIFVEIGAYDGVMLSSTKFFEDERNWSGICVEPIPEKHELLKKNRKCLTICACVSCERKTVDFMHVLGGDRYDVIEPGKYPKMRGKEHTEMLSGIVEHYPEKHRTLIKKELEELGGSLNIIRVQCITFDELLSNLNSKHINYLSVDTEGSEFQIVSNIDFNKYQIDVISVENLYSNEPQVKNLLLSKGYQLIKRCGYDEIYIRTST